MLILHLLGHERYDYATTTNIDDTDDRKNSDDGAANACRALQYRGQRRMVVPRLFLPLFCHDVICEEKYGCLNDAEKEKGEESALRDRKSNTCNMAHGTWP